MRYDLYLYTDIASPQRSAERPDAIAMHTRLRFAPGHEYWRSGHEGAPGPKESNYNCCIHPPVQVIHGVR